MSQMFSIASDYVDAACDLDPLLATALGVGPPSGEWGDFGPDGLAQYADLDSEYRPIVERAAMESPDDALASRVMLSAFDEADSAYQHGDHFLDLRHMASSFQQVRSTFQTMPADTPDERDAVTTRLRTVGQPLEGLRTLLSDGVSRGRVVARRQVESVVAQARQLATLGSSLDQIPAAEGFDEARKAYATFADWLESQYLPAAREDDGVGQEFYERAADRLVGMAIDAQDVHAWGWEEFLRLRAEMTSVAGDIRAGAGVLEVKDFLETDPSHTVEGPSALVEFVLKVLGDAVDQLAGSHFDVPEIVRPLTAQMAPEGGPLGVYYMRPSEDFSRPGGVWYSIGDQKRFPLYQHRSTAYHEGFPGHHLQIATAMLNSARLSRYQRLMTWCPGYGEGWAMYAEVLMGELGFLDDKRDYFGMLAKQMYRAARVVVDTGLHLGLTIDKRSPIAHGDIWTFENASKFMEVYGFRTADQARDEVLRYLGWPGQAIAYKLGEREILRMRQELGKDVSLRQFHDAVLSTGTVRLDTLRGVLPERLTG